MKKIAIDICAVIITTLCHRKKSKTRLFVASYLMKYVLKNVPKASEANNANTDIDVAKNICFYGNHKFANLVAPLIIKQKPREQTKVPAQNR